MYQTISSVSMFLFMIASAGIFTFIMFRSITEHRAHMKYEEIRIRLVSLATMLSGYDPNFQTYEAEFVRDMESCRYYGTYQKRLAVIEAMADKWDWMVSTGKIFNLKGAADAEEGQ